MLSGEAERRPWRRDALALLVVAVVLTLALGAPVDLAAAGFFYSPQPSDHWPLARRMPWSLLYRMAPWITASLLIAGVGAFGVSMLRRHAALRRHAIFILLSVIIGPGLLVNGVFKDHW